MTDGIAKTVRARLYDNFSRENYLFSLMTSVADQVGRGDTFDLPYQSAPTNRSSTTRAAPEAITPSVRTLSIDQEVFFNVNLPRLTSFQYLNGRWADNTAMHMSESLKNTMDLNLVNFLIKSIAHDYSATYHVNEGAATLTATHLQEAIAMVLSNDGRRRENLAWLVHPYGSASISSIAGFIPNYGNSEAGRVGLPMLGTVNGIPVYESNALLRNWTVSASASEISTNVLTLTVPSGHGIEPGMKITTAGATADVDTAAAVTSVTATTVVVPLASGDDASNGAATITVEQTSNLLVDTRSVFVAAQQIPEVSVREDFESAASALQAYCSYGRQAFAEGVAVVHSPQNG